MVQDRPVQSSPFISKANFLRTAFRYPTYIDFRCNHTPQTLIFAVIIPRTSLYGVCHCLIVGSEYIARSNATSNKTLNLFSAKFAFCIILCVLISMIIEQMEITEKKSKLTNSAMQRRPTASIRQSTAYQHRVFDVICSAL